MGVGWCVRGGGGSAAAPTLGPPARAARGAALTRRTNEPCLTPRSHQPLHPTRLVLRALGVDLQAQARRRPGQAARRARRGLCLLGGQQVLHPALLLDLLVLDLRGPGRVVGGCAGRTGRRGRRGAQAWAHAHPVQPASRPPLAWTSAKKQRASRRWARVRLRPSRVRRAAAALAASPARSRASAVRHRNSRSLSAAPAARARSTWKGGHGGAEVEAGGWAGGGARAATGATCPPQRAARLGGTPRPARPTASPNICPVPMPRTSPQRRRGPRGPAQPARCPPTRPGVPRPASTPPGSGPPRPQRRPRSKPPARPGCGRAGRERSGWVGCGRWRGERVGRRGRAGWHPRRPTFPPSPS